ncbi:hypothetical protein BC834DRAFT_887759 [Gloeopeniophorella convolvens]|nr:hypothetical protein BC834DRAFT_887759 [Gloeopeniophorella convolvens]
MQLLLLAALAFVFSATTICAPHRKERKGWCKPRGKSRKLNYDSLVRREGDRCDQVTVLHTPFWHSAARVCWTCTFLTTSYSFRGTQS